MLYNTLFQALFVGLTVLVSTILANQVPLAKFDGPVCGPNNQVNIKWTVLDKDSASKYDFQVINLNRFQELVQEPLTVKVDAGLATATQDNSKKGTIHIHASSTSGFPFTNQVNVVELSYDCTEAELVTDFTMTSSAIVDHSFASTVFTGALAVVMILLN